VLISRQVAQTFISFFDTISFPLFQVDVFAGKWVMNSSNGMAWCRG